MLSYLHRHLVHLALAAALATAGCASAPRPHAEIIGVADGRAADQRPVLLVFLEVRNPTGRTVKLSQLDYAMAADRWFASRGSLRVARSIRPGGSAVLEIPVPAPATAPPAAPSERVPYTLDGTLRVHTGTVEARWRVRARGALRAHSRPQTTAFAVVRPAPAHR
ncbi:MAG: hypothetical protein D6689_00425 [Deltaproteobacteria bacterium]|nr:MAG: hypothetical protein D6689_00425 [Deltaproteobacteria bacterium]